MVIFPSIASFSIFLLFFIRKKSIQLLIIDKLLDQGIFHLILNQKYYHLPILEHLLIINHN